MSAKHNSPPTTTRRIGLDCRLAGTKHAGIGRYISELIRHLLPLLKQQTTLVLFFFDQTQAKEVLGQDIRHPRLELIYAPIKHYGWQEQWRMPKVFAAAKLDLLHVPHWNVPLAYRGKLIVTIHDLLWHEQRGLHMTTLKPWQYLFKYLFYLLIVRQATRRATAIIVPAQTIADTVGKYYPSCRHKITVVKEGVAPAYQFTATAGKSSRKQLIYTGSLYPHKNLQLVIRALHKLPKYQLVVVGARNVFQDQIRQLVARHKVKAQVKFLGFVEDRKLIQLYSKASALVQPSLSEGFGLTGLEAMAAGLPVLASRIPIFAEIYQDGAIFFDPHDQDSFLSAVRELELADRHELRQKGQAVAAAYSWQQMATDIAAIYDKS